VRIERWGRLRLPDARGTDDGADRDDGAEGGVDGTKCAHTAHPHPTASATVRTRKLASDVE
jgi:hypothetical protein